ncbi:acyltransferase family protein [Corynebacterium sp. H78]|uniref:acyltransferase family protein n=1 Tax=Corynebacterium sp. H78 TaxID=3133417 RepID=UPI0030B62BDE
MASSRASRYRYDLDGLRGIAIALVVLFHVYVGRVSGGVDVFLLLSGYFFLGSLLRNAQRPEQSMNPWWSFWRTLRRLLPSLLLTLGVTTVAVLWLVPSLRSGEIAAQLTASVLYFQNYELAQQGADYEAATLETSPLQHLWSMSVQGQFYVLAITFVTILAWLLRKHSVDIGSTAAKRNARFLSKGKDATGGRIVPVALAILVPVTIASFVWALIQHGQNQPLNYYSLPTRLWELTLGAVLALALSLRARSSAAATTRTDETEATPFIYRILPFIGLAMVVSTGFFLDGARLFPGPWALWPIAGAVLIIVAGGRPSMATKILSSSPMRFLGDIAYSLYLWHWPLLIVSTAYFGQKKPTAMLGTWIIVVSVVLAWLTHRFVEKPMMQSRRRPGRTEPVVANAWFDLRRSGKAKAKALAGVALIVVAGLMLSLQPIHDSRLDDAKTVVLDVNKYPGALAITDKEPVPKVTEYSPDPDVIREMYPKPGLDGCVTMTPAPASELHPCIYGDKKSKKTMVLVGGSHSEQWFPALDVVAKKNGYKLITVLRQGCPSALGWVDNIARPQTCQAFNRNVLDYLDEVKADVVVTTTTRAGRDGVDFMPWAYEEFLNEVSDRGIRVIGIRDNPWPFDTDGHRFAPTSCMEDDNTTQKMPITDADRASKHGGNAPTKCDIPRKRAFPTENESKEVLESLPDAISVDFTDVFCDDNRCPAVIGNVYVYRDNNHVSVTFAKTLATELDRQVNSFLKEDSKKSAASSTSTSPSTSPSRSKSTSTSLSKPTSTSQSKSATPTSAR